MTDSRPSAGKKSKVDKKLFVPQNVAQKSLKVEDDLYGSVTKHGALYGYKIQTEIDRRLLLGIWGEDWPESCGDETQRCLKPQIELTGLKTQTGLK